MNNLFHHPTLSNVLAKATFPPDNQLAHVVNGQRNKLLLSLANTGKENYTLLNAAASYHDPAQHWALLSNTTASKYNVPLIAGSNFTLPFQVYSEFRPQELGLTVWANLRDAAGGVHRVVAYNETVTVVEPVGSLFDVQALFMYLILAAAIAGLSYLAYETLSARYFPSLSGKPTTGRKSTTTSTVKGTSSGKVLVATDGKGKGGYPASAQPYEEEWIPEHLTRKSGGAVKRKNTATTTTTTTANVAGEGAVSAGEMTSGGEGEKKKLGAGKGKGKGRK